MGSIHVLPKSVYPLNSALRNAFKDAQRVVFEIDLGDKKQDSALAESVQGGLYPKGEKLTDHLTPQTLDLLESSLPYFDLSMSQLEPMQPWRVSDLLMSLYLEENGYRSELGLDYHFFALAKKQGKPTEGLEKMTAQTAPFKNLSEAESDSYLRTTLASLPYTGIWFEQMIAAWRVGEVNVLDALINHSTKSEKGFYKSIFDDRNNAWMPQISGYLRSNEKVLVIVGSGHLVGQNGIVAQLRRKGYKVEQL